MEFEDLSSIIGFIQGEVEVAIESRVVPAIRNIEKDVIDEVVYDSYDPVLYFRRRDNKGLSDVRNMIYDSRWAGEELDMWISNMTKANDMLYGGKFSSDENATLAEIVEYGLSTRRQYVGHPYSFPRPFTEETQEILEDSGIVLYELRNALNFDIE